MLTWTLLLSVEKRLLQPKLIKYTLLIHSRDTFRNPLQSCLVFDSILDLWMIPSFRANFYPSCNIILPASMQRNKKRIDLYKCATSDFGFAKKKKNYHHHSTLLRRWFPNLPCLAYFDGTSRWVFPASFSRWQFLSQLCVSSEEQASSLRPDTTSEYFLVDIPEKGRILRFLKHCKLGKTELTHRLRNLSIIYGAQVVRR